MKPALRGQWRLLNEKLNRGCNQKLKPKNTKSWCFHYTSQPFFKQPWFRHLKDNSQRIRPPIPPETTLANKWKNLKEPTSTPPWWNQRNPNFINLQLFQIFLLLEEAGAFNLTTFASQSELKRRLLQSVDLCTAREGTRSLSSPPDAS